MSVFRAANNANSTDAGSTVNTRIRDPYPINRALQEPIPDGPTERIDDRPQHRRDRVAWLGVLFAIFSLTTSAIAVLAAWRAMTLAQMMAQGGGAVAVARPQTTDFAVTYAQEPLRVQVGCAAVALPRPRRAPVQRRPSRSATCATTAAAAQDVPRLDASARARRPAPRSRTPTPTRPAANGRSATARSARAPASRSSKGAVLCVLTAATPASMVLVEVTDVGQTGTAAMRATSWRVAG